LKQLSGSLALVVFGDGRQLWIETRLLTAVA
jgi:hypothetical protein